ncbi:PREDICTED: protein ACCUMULATION AND REPLICATION OF CHLOROPLASTS 6, chloroplastic isoform X2 [Tarenaya hassleriana]|uniref:protein ACCUMULATION AND REPLICATION OF CHLOROPLASTS 6, chloroplastic isoform X2 n=1 Tax=Tarenaya hassleriana TaxID=28532 RepID=UPI00053CA975|nr:PREDICTED: protein ACCUMULATION AND REPLICATION OF CHLOROPLASTS 6, chloroplastic isoform X2 [Tarenaya hassleriana]
MEALGHVAVGLCSLRKPRQRPPMSPAKLRRRHSATTLCSASKWADRLLSDFNFTTDSSSSSSSSVATATLAAPPPSLAPPDRHIPIPIDFYQVLGAEMHFLTDGIRRAYESRVSKPPQFGFSDDALISRRQFLQAACETLSNPRSRREYNQGLLDDEEDTIITEVPWDKVPGALCVLQEAGETEVVLRIGEALLNERLPKSFKQDVVLVMALAFVDVSRDAMALDPPDFIIGYEFLERALKLLQEEGASNLATDLRAQIDETLEEITPRYVLELLGFPLGEEYRGKRLDGLRDVRNILWSVGGGGASAIVGGLTREKFMNEAFSRMTAAEQVDLFVATPSNIPAESFEVYEVALALVAQAFIGKKPHLIQDADKQFQQLQQARAMALESPALLYAPRDNWEMDFALERGLCALLIGKVDECRTWLGLDSEVSPYRNPSIVEFVMDNSNHDDDHDLPGLCKLLETWLAGVVFPRFRDSKDKNFKLGDYYDDPMVLSYLERVEVVQGSPLAAAAAMARIGAEHVKASAIQALQKVFPPREVDGISGTHKEDIQETVLPFSYSGGNLGPEESQNNFSVEESEGPSENCDSRGSVVQSEVLKNGIHDIHVENSIADRVKDASVKIASAGVVLGVITLAGLKFLPAKSSSSVPLNDMGSAMASDIGATVAEDSEAFPRMNARTAENLVRTWQNIKSQAFGQAHRIDMLPEVLDGRMLKIWTDRAAETSQLGLVYDYTLMKFSIDSVTVSADGNRALVEATLEESARLTDLVHPENNATDVRTYTTRYEATRSKSGWKITQGSVLTT